MPQCDALDALLVYRDTLLGLSALHNTGRLHGDVKPANIVVKLNTGGHPIFAALSDVGGHVSVDQWTFVTADWRPLQLSVDDDGDADGSKDDVYAAGLVLVACATGREWLPHGVLSNLPALLRAESRVPAGLGPSDGLELVELVLECAQEVLGQTHDERRTATAALFIVWSAINRCKALGLHLRR
eukprot:TRINITY_DN39974_c0_g1_i2.p1 TRINITY_DN39974_c0_g1~~TRINITY_DN39974_c0_g1_i2.p1  ORF type:complete len:185 (+),score=31.90 TRINITY_DN39974_c0_g1_i2:266-820(+)